MDLELQVKISNPTYIGRILLVFRMIPGIRNSNAFFFFF